MNTLRKALVVVSGGPGLSSSYLVPYLKPFDDLYECIFYDQLGCGTDSTPVDAISSGSTADQLTDLLRARGTNVDVLTHSWGSHVLFTALGKTPHTADLIDRAILVNPTPLKFDQYAEAGSALEARLEPEDLKIIMDLIQSGADHAGDELMRRALYAYTGSRERLPDLQFEYSLVTAEAVNNTLGKFDLRPVASALSAKLTLILGAQDYIQPEYIRCLMAVSARVGTVNGAGHFPFAENPAEFERTLRDLLVD